LLNISNERRKSCAETFPWQFKIRNSRTTAKVAQVWGSRAVDGHQHTLISCRRLSILLSHPQKFTATLCTPVTSMTTKF
jgi:hypothetical protein